MAGVVRRRGAPILARATRRLLSSSSTLSESLFSGSRLLFENARTTVFSLELSSEEPTRFLSNEDALHGVDHVRAPRIHLGPIDPPRVVPAHEEFPL